MSEIYIPLKENELPGLRESIQNFDINDVDVEPMKAVHPMSGMKHLPESIQLMRESSTGKKHSEETRKKMSGPRKRGWKMSPDAWTEERRQKQRERMLGKPMSEENKEKLRKPKKNGGGKKPPRTEEHKRKLSEAIKRRWETHPYTHTPETKQKISESSKRMWTERREEILNKRNLKQEKKL